MANTVYANFIIENKIEDLLTTKVDLNNYMTIDTSLSENAGMIKKIHTYKATGNVEDVEMGSGNTSDIEVSFTEKDYTVKVTQGRFAYYDEQAMQDPNCVDVGLKGVVAKMANDLTAKAIAEFEKASKSQQYTTTITFDNVVDAIAQLNLEDETGLFMLIAPDMVASFRKSLKDLLSYSEDFVRTGYIGSVSGVPVIVSKAVASGKAYIADKTAVTCFIKKGVEIEQERDANTRKNTIYGRKVAVVALTDDTKVVKFTAG